MPDYQNSRSPNTLKGIIAERDITISKLENERRALEAMNDRLSKQIGDLSSENSIIKERLEELASNAETIESFCSRVHDMQEAIENAHNILTIDNETGYSLLTSSRLAHEKILSVRDELIGSPQKDDSSEKQTGMFDKISEYHQQITEVHARIRKLLPVASSASLAHAYHDAKIAYKYPLSSCLESKDKTAFISWAASMLQSMAYYTLFISPLVLIVLILSKPLIGLDLLTAFLIKFNLPTLSLEASLQESIPGVWGAVAIWIARVTLSTPLLLISLFGYNSIKLNRRLHEEYNHKQRVMQLYEGFKSELDTRAKDNGELAKRLLEIMLETVAEKPAPIENKTASLERLLSKREKAKASQPEKPIPDGA